MRIMERKAFKCAGCAYLVFAQAGAKAPEMCPMCRGALEEVSAAAPEGAPEWACEECGCGFATAPGARDPYKCPQCNFTIPRAPGPRGG